MSKILLELEYYELVILQKSLQKEIQYIKTCDFEKEYQPLDFTRKDALEMLVEIEEKLRDSYQKSR